MVYTAKHSSPPRPPKKIAWLWIVVCGIAVIVAAVALLEFTNTTHLFHAKKAVSGPIPAKAEHTAAPEVTQNPTASDQPPQTSEPNSPAPKPVPGGSGGSSTNTNGAPLTAPYGSFVSNHKPGQNGSPMDEQSICVTTPGATCTIIFKNGPAQRTLEARVADSSGTVIWNWKINESGLTKGTWTITASASLNGQTKTTDDKNPLEVQ